MPDIECFFDCSSPWTYFAFHNLLLMQKELGIDDRLAADPGRRRVQRGQPQRAQFAREAGAGEGRLQQEGPAGLGAPSRHPDALPADACSR